MRKIFANLKSVVALAVVAAMTLSVSCMYDDTALTKRVNKVEKDLAALTEKVNGLAGQEVTLENLLAGNLVITGVTTDAAGNTVVSLSNGESFTVLAEAETLQYRTENGVLEISADGETWVAVTADAACLVKEVRTNADGTITIVFANGTEFTSAVAELIECKANRSQVYVLPESTKVIPFTVNDAVEDINVMNQPFGWSATVEAAETRAAGGTEYVLNITGPAEVLVAEGLAAKEGVVSVHFNTAAGACKVMKVDVSLAELTLSVDKNGNVTITNSVAMEQEDHWGDKYFDFANFYYGIMPKSLYEQYGNNALIEDYDEMACDNVIASFSQRGSGLTSVVDELPYYEDGVTEFESFELTLDEFCSSFYPDFQVVPGEEYIIFVSLSEVMDMSLYAVFPDLSNAIMVEYKSVVVDAVVDAESATSNDVNLTLSLAGYNYFLVAAVSQAQIDEYIEEGYVSSREEFYGLYLRGNWGGLNMQAGAIIPGVMNLQTTYASLAELSMTGYIPALEADTEYRLIVYPFNVETEMDFQTMVVNGADVFDFGTFTTAGLVPGNFDAIANYEVAEMTVRRLIVNADFNEDVEVAKFAYEWFEGPALDPEQRIQEMLNGFFYTTDYFSSIEAEYNSPVYPAYLGVLVVNTDGQYVYEETVYEFVESYNFEVEFTSADFVDGVLKFQGADANDYLDVIMNPGLTSIVAGEYAPVQPDWFNGGIMPWSSADALEFDGSNSKYNLSALPGQYGYYLTEYGKMTVALEGDVYTIVITDLGYIDSKYQPVKFTYTGKFGIEEEESDAAVFNSATVAPADDNLNYHYITFTDGTDNAIIKLCTRGTTEYSAGHYDQNGSFSNAFSLYIGGYTTDCTWNGAECWPVTMDVIDNGDGTVTINLVYNEYPSGVQHKGTYTGVLEGLTLVAPKQLPTTENLTLSLKKYTANSGYCDVVFEDPNGKNVIVISLNDCPLVDCTYTVESSSAESIDPGTMYLNGCYVEYDGYQAGTSAYLQSGSVDVKANGDGTYTITFDLVLDNGQAYTGVFTGEIK